MALASAAGVQRPALLLPPGTDMSEDEVARVVMLEREISKLQATIEKIQKSGSDRHGAINVEVERVRRENNEAHQLLITQMANSTEWGWIRTWVAPIVLITVASTCLGIGVYVGRAEVVGDLRELAARFNVHALQDAHGGAVPRRELEAQLQEIDEDLEQLQHGVQAIEEILMDGPPLR